MPNDPASAGGTGDIRILQGPQFHATAIDQGIVQLGTDGTTVTVRLTLLRRSFRFEQMKKVEHHPSAQDGEASYRLEGQPYAVEEFEAIMEPHDAFRLALQVLGELKSLPSAQLERYGLGELHDEPTGVDENGSH